MALAAFSRWPLPNAGLYQTPLPGPGTTYEFYKNPLGLGFFVLMRPAFLPEIKNQAIGFYRRNLRVGIFVVTLGII
jgi:hypothetical protein